MIILLHSSKTMRLAPFGKVPQRSPLLIKKAEQLAEYLKTFSAQQLQGIMHISPVLAQKTHKLLANWTTESEAQSLALDTFVGDIYSGLQAATFSSADRDHADKVLRILSGLYGVIRPYDAICPYRLEMGYKFPDPEFASLYKFWGDSISETLPKEGLIVNLSSEEFADTVTPFVNESRVVVPKFLTVSPKTGEPTFVVIHAKIARGAFAGWLIKHRVNDVEALNDFRELGYHFDKKLSTLKNPTFVCEEFGGKGLSIKGSLN